MNAIFFPNIIFTAALWFLLALNSPPIYRSQTNLVAFCFCCLEPIDFCMSSGQRLIPSWPKSFHLSPRKTKKAIFIWKKKTLKITQVYHLPRRVCANVFLLYFHPPPKITTSSSIDDDWQWLCINRGFSILYLRQPISCIDPTSFGSCFSPRT